jgi:serine/threonine protein phosphatase PrpC
LLTTAHVGSNREEAARVALAGGRIEKAVSADEKPRLNGVLEVTRSFGDFQEVGITVAPAVKRVRLTEDDAFLIVATDGLWDGVPFQTAVRFNPWQGSARS